MNTAETKKFVVENRVVTLRADKTHDAPEVDQLLVELGNTARTIPYLAIFPGKRGEPIILEGPVTRDRVVAELERAVGF